MENKKVSVWQGVLNPAIILGSALIIYSLILYLFDQSFNRTLGLVSYLIIPTGVVLGIRTFRQESRGGIISYGQAVDAGTVIGLYAGIIGAFFTYLLYEVIDPDLMEKFYTSMKEQMLEKGNIPEEMIEQSMETMKVFMSPLVRFSGTFYGSVLYAVIISLIAANFLKNENDKYQKDMAAVKDVEKPDLTQKPPKTWLVESILVTLFCCLPFGIAGIVNASKVESRFYAGDNDGANRASEQAGKWTKLGFWISLAIIIIYIILLISGVMSKILRVLNLDEFFDLL